MTTPHSNRAIGSGSGSSGGIGTLAAKYESSGSIGTIANNPGDIGGASYGKYQIATNTGTMSSYLSYLKSNFPDQYRSLTSAGKPGSSAFNSAWKSLASKDPSGFEQSQEQFIKESHYEPARANVIKGTGVDFSKRSIALQNVLFSVATQHGTGGAGKLIKRAGITPGMSDTEIINRIYNERSADNGMRYFSGSSPAVRNSVVNRFKQERQDALNMLGGR